MTSLQLYPTPQRLALQSGRADVPQHRSISGCPSALAPLAAQLGAELVAAQAWITCTIDATIAQSEGYELRIATQGVTVRAHDQAGLRWALTTLKQIMASNAQTLPCVDIADHPAFPHRGVMLDISRDRVPTMATLRDLVDRLADLKMNCLQLYAEHSVAYPGHEAVWRNADPITLDELAELGAYAAARGIALDANQNSLGHWERWLRVPQYAHLGEISTGTMVRRGWYVDPTTLYPGDPAALALVCDLLRQQIAVCPGAFVNIGCDEPWELGQGRSKERCEREGTATVFSEWVSQVARSVTATGKRPQFWCDPHPRENDSLPQDLIALVWGYDIGTDFATRARAHRKSGRAVWVCPGSGCWNSTTGRSDTHKANLRNARDQGLAEGAEGFLCTVWGDNGHHQPWPVTLYALANAAQAAWGHGDYDAAAAGLRMFGSADLGTWLDECGQVDAVIRSGKGGGFNEAGTVVHNQNATFADMNRNLQDPSGPGDIDAWRAVAANIEAVASRMPAMDPLLARECRHGLNVARWAAQRAIVRRGAIDLEQRQCLAEGMVPIIAEHRALWLQRSRYGGLEDSCVRYKRHVWWY